MDELSRASDAIAKEDWKAALGHVLAAWRDRRHPRLAALVDRVARHLPTEGIPDKTLGARQAKWLELAAKKDPADVGVLLATPWPTRWQDNVPLMTALAEFPDDPRIALAVARHATSVTYDSFKCVGFYRPALGLLLRADDPRTKPLLEEALAREQTYKWRADVAPIFTQAIDRFQRADDLTLEEARAVAAVEALFDGEDARAKTTQKTEAEFLAAIHADPDDDTPRGVYADWLTEKGDPRGEFISLQLAPQRTGAAEKRMAALLKKHGATWAGPFAKLFREEGRRFSRGFFAGGVLIEDDERPLEGSFDLRYLAGISESTAVRLAMKGLAPRLEELGIHSVAINVDAETKKSRAVLTSGFPRLKSLQLYAAPETVLSYFDTPMPPMLERIIVNEGLAALKDRLEKTKLVAIELRYGALTDLGAWRFELLRDTDHRFTRLRAGPVDPAKPVPKEGQLASVLKTLPQLTELVVHGTRSFLGLEEIAPAEAAIAAIPSLQKVEVPWERGSTGTLNRFSDEVVAETLRVRLQFKDNSERFLTDYDRIWNALTQPPLSLPLDSFSHRMGARNGPHKSLGTDPVAQLKKELAKKHTHKVTVYSKQAPNSVNACFDYYGVEVTLPCGADFRLDDFLAWLNGVIANGDYQDVTSRNIQVRGGGLEWTGWQLKAPEAPGLFWITCFTRQHAKLYDHDEVAKAATTTISGCRVLQTEKLLVLITSDSPEVVVSEEQRDAFDAELNRLYKGEVRS